MSSPKVELRVVTYMCPTHPVELYELILELLEEAVGCWATLQYESRAQGPLPGRPDPFTNDQVDLAFMSAASYMAQREHNQWVEPVAAQDLNLVWARCEALCTARPWAGAHTAHALRRLWVELLGVTPVFMHPLNSAGRPGYFCDVIIHSDKKAHNVNTLLDLRGCTFAYSDEESLSGCKLVLKTLKEKGENASFFGSLLRSGSHWASAQMVLSKQAEWAAVDSTTLLYSKKFMQDGGKDITILETLGCLPPYPIVVNSRLPTKTKSALTEALLKLPHTQEWKKRFAKFGVVKFDVNSNVAYDGPAAQVRAASASEKLNVRYY